MTDPSQQLGKIGWMDLTVDNADEVKKFYEAVTGWESDAVDMGEYSDYCVKPPNADPVAGICHKRGANADVPSGWLIYINVDNLEQRIQTAEQLGGKIIVSPRKAGSGRFAVIEDPAGNIAGLYQA